MQGPDPPVSGYTCEGGGHLDQQSVTYTYISTSCLWNRHFLMTSGMSSMSGRQTFFFASNVTVILDQSPQSIWLDMIMNPLL